MRLRSLLVAVLAALVLAVPAVASAAEWRAEQPLTEGSVVPSSIGTVYDIEFWSPNRGALITANGVWAYDGTGWHRYSTVCGGTGGRIAWAGPTDFWTISDQRLGQAQPEASLKDLQAISLCHFRDGAVVASYAEPTGLVTSWEHMNAAACLGPNDCWFGGELLPGHPNTGAFHLHWNGATLTALPSLTQLEPETLDPPRAVSGMATVEGSLFESLRIDAGAIPGELREQPTVLHQISEETSPPSFPSILASRPLEYGGGKPSELGGFLLSGDGASLWGIAGRLEPAGKPVPVVAFRYLGGAIEPIKLANPTGPTSPTDPLAEEPMVSAIAAVPGGEEAWVGYNLPDEYGHNQSPARLALLHSDGTVDSATELPVAGEELAHKGIVSALACPAFEQCWMATTGGWLFHLGEDLPRDEAPAMHQLITFRPPDGGTQSLPPDSLPIDNSGSEPEEKPALEPLPKAPAKEELALPLVIKVKQHLVGRTLELTFTLTAKARVRFIAKRHGKVVAKTPLQTLTRGHHELRLRLDPKHWPTKFHLEAKPVGKKK
jgi:hypothetical protein